MKDEGPGSIARARLLLLPKNMSRLVNKSSSCKLHASMLSSQATRELSAFMLKHGQLKLGQRLPPITLL